MRIYAVGYIGSDDVGYIKGFTNKKDATKFKNQLKRDEDCKQIYEMDALDFPANKKGLIAALQWGAEMVYK